MSLLYEGKGKRVFTTELSSEQVVFEFKDDLTAFNAQKRGSFAGKGAICCEMASLLLAELKREGELVHFVEMIGPQKMLVQKLRMLPLEVVVRNQVAGSLQKKFNRPEGEVLAQPLVEYYYKDDALSDPFVSEEQILVFGWANAVTLAQVKARALKVNQILRERFLRAGLLLIDFKLEYGFNAKGELCLGDDISPDSCRIWNKVNLEKLDKDRFRQDLGRVDWGYHEILQRLKDSYKL